MNTVLQAIKQHERLLNSFQTIWVGFSGGLDSTVLLHVLAQQTYLKNKLKVIHVHHGLSVNADAWLEHSRQFCQSLQIPFVAEKVQLSELGDGVEQAARQARYAAYEKYLQPQDVLVLAHHNDDQIETFFMRLSRGSGLKGLAGMPQQRAIAGQATLLRPLLAVSRTELEVYANKEQLVWVEDESNNSSDYERNWWRNELLPKIWQQFPQRKESLQRSLSQLQQDQVILTELLAPLIQQVQIAWPWPQCATVALSLPILASFPVRYQAYLVKGWLEGQGLLVSSKQWLENLVQEAQHASADKQPQWRIGNVSIHRHAASLFIHTPQAEPRPLFVTLDREQSIVWGGAQLNISSGCNGLISGTYQIVSADNVREQKISPFKRPSKTLKALFQESSVPAVLRHQWPALIDEHGHLCALIGIAADEAYMQGNGADCDSWSLSWCN